MRDSNAVIMDLRDTYFGFKGRLNRGRYWLNSLLAFVVAGVLELLDIYFFPVPEEVIKLFHSQTVQDVVVWILLFAPAVTFVYISTAISVKRLHDRDKSGWWALLYLALPTLLLLTMIESADADHHITGWPAAMMIPYFILLIVTFLELACLKGTTGPNRYGPDPLAAHAPSAHLSTAP
jgi:uncharacterized membrane protein YhaH (DUF805 family)